MWFQSIYFEKIHLPCKQHIELLSLNNWEESEEGGWESKVRCLAVFLQLMFANSIPCKDQKLPPAFWRLFTQQWEQGMRREKSTKTTQNWHRELEAHLQLLSSIILLFKKLGFKGRRHLPVPLSPHGTLILTINWIIFSRKKGGEEEKFTCGRQTLLILLHMTSCWSKGREHQVAGTSPSAAESPQQNVHYLV